MTLDPYAAQVRQNIDKLLDFCYQKYSFFTCVAFFRTRNIAKASIIGSNTYKRVLTCILKIVRWLDILDLGHTICSVEVTNKNVNVQGHNKVIIILY